MLIVVAIIVLISSIVLANNNKFGGTILLQNLAYDVALSARQAQTYGTAVIRFGSNNFTAPYGIHFDITASRTTYYVFADAVGSPNGIYDVGEMVQSSTIGRGYFIESLCVTASNGSESCTSGTTISKLDVVYKRPEPDAYIRADDISTTYTRGRVILSSPRGDLLSVWFENNGQISVHN